MFRSLIFWWTGLRLGLQGKSRLGTFCRYWHKSQYQEQSIAVGIACHARRLLSCPWAVSALSTTLSASSTSTMASQTIASMAAAPVAAARPCSLHSRAKPTGYTLTGHSPFLQGNGLRVSRCCPRITRASTAMRCQGDYKVKRMH